MKKKSALWVPALNFDSSGSAMVRFFGTPFEVDIHWVDDLAVSMLKMVCPASVPSTEKIECPLCALPIPHEKSIRFAAICWDITNNKWSVFMAMPYVFTDLVNKCKKAGVIPQMITEGKGPDVLIQRMGKNTTCAIITESIGKECKPPQPKGEEGWAINEKCPSLFTRIVNGVAEYSVWTKCKSPKEAKMMFPKGETLIQDVSSIPPTPLPPFPNNNYTAVSGAQYFYVNTNGTQLPPNTFPINVVVLPQNSPYGTQTFPTGESLGFSIGTKEKNDKKAKKTKEKEEKKKEPPKINPKDLKMFTDDRWDFI